MEDCSQECSIICNYASRRKLGDVLFAYNRKKKSVYEDPDFKKQGTGLYDEVCELSEGLEHLHNEGKDTTGTIERLEEVLEEFLLFRKQEGGQRPAS
ncbi:MAG: hypothetical protein H6Q72_3853 [Firmicutes bacterium]|nr:hypothetical protein [Bacillota bacterium]